MMPRYAVLVFTVVAAVPATSFAQAHDQHTMPPATSAQPAEAPMDHSMHSGMGGMQMPMSASTQSDVWAYSSREQPLPYPVGQRWEMVLVPEYGHMFISTQGLNDELVCAALANPAVAVDRATAARCKLPAAAIPAVSPASAPTHADHNK